MTVRFALLQPQHHRLLSSASRPLITRRNIQLSNVTATHSRAFSTTFPVLKSPRKQSRNPLPKMDPQPSINLINLEESNPDLHDELLSLHGIYGDDSLEGPLQLSSNIHQSQTLSLSTSSSSGIILHPPPGAHIFLFTPPDLPVPVTFKLALPEKYPSDPPVLLSLTIEGPRRPDHYTTTLLTLSREFLQQAYETCQGVCLFDFAESIRDVLPPDPLASTAMEMQDEESDHELPSPPLDDLKIDWFITEPTTQLKSVFIGYATHISSPSQVAPYYRHLIASDKKLQKATHNMYAYRCLDSTTGRMVADNEDDGEAGAGARLGSLLALMGVENVLVIVARWYGGVKLGGDRFRLIGAVGREAVVGLLGEGKDGEQEGEKGVKKKGGKKKH